MNVLEALEKIMFDKSLKLYSQPQFDLASGKLKRHEVLLRFPTILDFEAGPKTTSEWISLIKSQKGLRSLTDWIVDKVAFFLKNNKYHSPLSVNVSPTMVDDAFVESVIRAFKRYDVRLSRFGLEITEDFEPESFQYFNESLNRLRSLGVYIALDDFGAGYSSMKYLIYSTVDAVKIDKSFIKHASTDSGAIVMGTLINGIRAFSIEIICEGIETEEHLNLAKAFGIDTIQGFLIGQPSYLI